MSQVVMGGRQPASCDDRVKDAQKPTRVRGWLVSNKGRCNGWYCRSEVPAPQAAHSIRDFRSIKRYQINKFASAHDLPKFVKAGAVMEHELRKVGTSRNHE